MRNKILSLRMSKASLLEIGMIATVVMPLAAHGVSKIKLLPPS